MKTVTVTDTEFELLRMWSNRSRGPEYAAFHKRNRRFFWALRESISTALEASEGLYVKAKDAEVQPLRTMDKSEFRSRMKLLHPDLNGSGPTDACRKFIEDFKDLPKTTAVAFPGFRVLYNGQWWQCTDARRIWPRRNKNINRRFHPMALTLQRNDRGRMLTTQITSLQMDDAQLVLANGYNYRLRPTEPGVRCGTQPKVLPANVET